MKTLRHHRRDRLIGAYAWSIFVIIILAGFGSFVVDSTCVAGESSSTTRAQSDVRVGVFDVDASPPVGTMMAYDPVAGVQTPLRFKGIVLLSKQQPVVLASIDWLGISNEGSTVFKERIAAAAKTTSDRVMIHTIHQHDAPACDFALEAMLHNVEAENVPFNASFAREVLDHAVTGVQDAIQNAKPVTHVGHAEAQVHLVASNRRVLGSDGQVQHVRWSATKDPVARASPEGVIDPKLKLISFWSDSAPIAVLSYYATHPQSYYRTGLANPDFPGMARDAVQKATGVPFIHFNGAGGNITAGKYNDGDKANRQILADRVYGAMVRAWSATKREAIDANTLNWQSERVLLPPGKSILGDASIDEAARVEEALHAQLSDKALSTPARYAIANKILFLRRFVAKEPISIGCLTIGGVRILHMPGELFVEYQLAAQRIRPDLFVCMAAYGEYSPWYIGTAISYSQGGYETGKDATMVGPECESILIGAIGKLLAGDVSKLGSIGTTSNEPDVGVIRIGIIGCDTSHVPAFADAFNASNASGAMAGFKVTAAYPGGSSDIPTSINRVPGFTEHLKKMNVEIVDSVEAMLPKVDVVLLESVDGRKHLEQCKPVLMAGKRLFIDKPVAGSLADTLAIYGLAAELSVPVFSSSSLRFSPGIIGLRNDPKVGKVIGCETWGPCSLEEHHPDLYWYGVHGVEMLYTIMGTGCESVSRTHTAGTDVVVGSWSDGRVGTFRGIRSGASGYGGTVFGEKGIVPCGEYTGYGPLLEQVATFFKTGIVPVSPEETIEMFAWMEAADESKRQGGVPIRIADVMQKAQLQIGERSTGALLPLVK